MHQLPRLTRGRNEVEPPPRDMQPLTQPKNPVGQRIAVVMVIKQPAIEFMFTEGGLDGRKVHRSALADGLLHDTLPLPKVPKVFKTGDMAWYFRVKSRRLKCDARQSAGLSL